MADKTLLVKIKSYFTAASSRANLVSGEELPTSLGKIAKYLGDLKTVAFSGSYNDLSNKPTIPDISTKVSKSGDTMTGNLAVKSSNIDRNGANPSSTTTGNSYVKLVDRDLDDLGSVYTYREPDGTQRTCISAINTKTDSSVGFGIFGVGVKKDGSVVYTCTSPSAFRDAIDAAHDVQCDYNTDNGVKNLCNLDWFNTDNVFQNAYVESMDINSGKLIAYTPASDTTHTYCGVNVYSKFNDILENGKTYTLSWTVDSLTNNGLFGFRRTSNNAYITPTSGTYNVNATGDAYYTFTYDSSIPVYLSLCVNTSATSSLKRIALSNIMLREAIITDSTFVPYAEPNYILTRNSKLYEISDTTPYLYKSSEHDAVYDELVGGSVAWNQLVQNGNFESTSGWISDGGTLSASNNILNISTTASWQGAHDTHMATTNHIYLYSCDVKKTTASDEINLYAGSMFLPGTILSTPTNTVWNTIQCVLKYTGTSASTTRPYLDNVTATVSYELRNCMFIDLTLMFGSTIADYVYNLEQSTAGSGIAWLKSYGFCTKDYYAYNAGGLISVNTSGKKVVGKNLLDASQIVVGSIGGQGQDISSNTRLRTAYISVLPNTTYTAISGNNVQVYEYHEYRTDKSHIKFVPINATSGSNTMSPDTHFIRLLFRYSDNRIMEVSDMPNPQLELGSTATNYEPYTSITYPIQSTDLRGLYKLSGSQLYTDGDIYSADGTVTRKYGIVDLGTLDWNMAANNKFFANVEEGTTGIITNALCTKYVVTNAAFANLQDKQMNYGQPARSLGWRAVAVRDSAYTDAATFKTAMSGVYLIYELATPATAPAPPFTSPQMVYRNGTEEYLDTRDVPLPVGGNRKYVDIPEWMVNEYFDDVRSSASGAIKGDLVFDESSSAHGHGLISSDNKKAIVFNHDKIDITSSSGGSRGYIADGDEMATITLRQGDVEISGHKHSSQGDSHSSYLAIYPDGIEISVVSADDGIIVSGLDSGTGVNLILAPDGTIYKASSSRNVKHDIEYVEDTNGYHDALMQLKPATFIYNSDKTETQKLGMIAEDVADVCPIAGMVDKNGKVENYDDRAIITMLVAEVQRLNKLINKKEENQNE